MQGFDPCGMGSSPIRPTEFIRSVMGAHKILILVVSVRILSDEQHGVSSLFGKAPHCEWGEQGSSPGVHPKWNSSVVGLHVGLKHQRCLACAALDAVFDSGLFHN